MASYEGQQMAGQHASTATAQRRRGGYEGQHRAEGPPVRCTCPNQALAAIPWGWTNNPRSAFYGAAAHLDECAWRKDVFSRLVIGQGGTR